MIKKLLADYFTAAGLPYDDGKLEQSEMFYKLVTEENRTTNITSIDEDPDEYAIMHFYDSLMPSKMEVFQKASSFIDLGSGAGFPGMVLKIFYPDKNIIFIDSVRKKVDFIAAAAGKLGLSGWEALHSRAEDAGRDKKYRETSPLLICRALAPLNQLVEYAAPLVAADGHILAMKGSRWQEELDGAVFALRELGMEYVSDYAYPLPERDMNRHLLLLKKIKPCSDKYPRKAGTPKKHPLLG